MNLSDRITITKICSVSTVNSPQGRIYEMKSRKNFGLSFCEYGKITYYHNGKKYVSDRNHAIFLPKGESYSLYGDKDGMFPIVNFQCSNDFCEKEFHVFPIHHAESYLKDFYHLNKLNLFSENRAKCMSILYDLLSRVFSNEVLSQDPIDPAISYLEQHYSDHNLTNEILARQANLSEVYFRRLFSARFHQSPKQYILEIRIRQAKQLLQSGSMTVTEIADACGFSGIYHFCRAFKKITGLTPTQYRKEFDKYGI